MKWIKQLQLLFSFWILSGNITAQNFTNPDLEGPINGPSNLPPNWQSVPFEDVNCFATSAALATPDLTDANGGAAGILGNPYSGETFVSGLYGGTNSVFHEGIQQSVSGFSISQAYVISFYQTVIKQVNAIDAAGSWAVYIDGNLRAIAPVSRSPVPHSNTTHVWDNVNVTFTATASSHLFQFLPYDDDTNRTLSVSDTTGALRMGIDNIQILNSTVGLKPASRLPVIARVFPNPFGVSTTIQFKNDAAENYTFELYNHSGQRVKTVDGITNTTIILKKEDLTPGFYFFVLGTKGRPAATGKLTVE